MLATHNAGLVVLRCITHARLLENSWRASVGNLCGLGRGLSHANHYLHVGAHRDSGSPPRARYWAFVVLSHPPPPHFSLETFPFSIVFFSVAYSYIVLFQPSHMCIISGRLRCWVPASLRTPAPHSQRRPTVGLHMLARGLNTATDYLSLSHHGQPICNRNFDFSM
jgi:hypothetical protein